MTYSEKGYTTSTMKFSPPEEHDHGTDNTGVVLAANPSGGQNGGSYSSGVNSLANGYNAPESAYMKATGKEETDTDTQADEEPTQEKAK